MTVADLDNVELLDDARVQSELFGLELGKNGASEVDSHDIEELHLGLEIALISLNIASHRAHIVRVLEHRGHRLFALVHVFNVSLRAFNLLFDILNALLAIKILFVSGVKGLQVVDLSLVPVVQISEGIAQVLGRVSHLTCQVVMLAVLHDKERSITFAVEFSIGLLVVAEDISEAGVCLQHALFLLQILGKIFFHLL